MIALVIEEHHVLLTHITCTVNEHAGTHRQ